MPRPRRRPLLVGSERGRAGAAYRASRLDGVVRGEGHSRPILLHWRCVNLDGPTYEYDGTPRARSWAAFAPPRTLPLDNLRNWPAHKLQRTTPSVLDLIGIRVAIPRRAPLPCRVEHPFPCDDLTLLKVSARRREDPVGGRDATGARRFQDHPEHTLAQLGAFRI